MDASGYNLKDRVRKVDMTKLTPEEADILSEQIGTKLRELVDRTVEEANTFLKIYGMRSKMQFALEQIEQEPKGQ